MDMFKHVYAIHVFVMISRLDRAPVPSRAFLPSIVSHFQLCGCSPHQNRWPSQRIDPRALLHQPTSPTVSFLPRSREFCGVGRQLAPWC